jgi:hypothetical protein
MRLESLHIDSSKVLVIIFGKRNQRKSNISLAAEVTQKLLVFMSLNIIFYRSHLDLTMTITLF